MLILNWVVSLVRSLVYVTDLGINYFEKVVYSTRASACNIAVNERNFSLCF